MDAFQVHEKEGHYWIATIHDISFVWVPDQPVTRPEVDKLCEAMNAAFEIGQRSGDHAARAEIRRALGVRSG